MDGIHVVMRTVTELNIALGGELFVGRFLFLPASLRANDRVWIRIERQIDASDGSAVDVTARVLGVLPHARSVVPWRPHAGLRFLMTIDSFGAAGGVGDGPTRGRFDANADSERNIERTIAVNVLGLRSDERRDAFAAVDDGDDVDPTERAASRSEWEETLREVEHAGSNTAPDFSAVCP